MAQRRAVLVRQNRLGQRREQGDEALHALGQCPRRDPQPHVGQPCRDPMQWTPAHEALEEDAHPHADSVGRGVEQPRYRGRRHFPRRGRALAASAVAGAHDLARVRADLHLDEARATRAVRHIGLGATRTHARIVRRMALFLLLPEPRPLGAAMSGRAALLTALAPRARCLLLLALAPEHRLRQHRPGRAQLPKLDFQRPHARCQRRVRVLQLPHLGAQAGIVHAQRHHRAALARCNTGLRKKLLQPLDFALQGKGVFRDAPDCLRLLLGRPQIAPAPVELPLQRPRPGTGLHLRPAQLFATRLDSIRPRALALVQ